MTNAKILILIIFCISLNAFAYTPQEGNVTAAFGPFISRTDYSGNAQLEKTPWFGDFGLIIQGDLNTRGALEIALFHMQKEYVRHEAQSYISEKTDLVHITMGYRRWISPRWSASLAFSSSYPIGEKIITHNDFQNRQAPETSASDTVDYGLDLSIQTELWNNEKTSVFSDIRYGLSVTDKPNETGSHYGLMIGLKYLIQEKFGK